MVNSVEETSSTRTFEQCLGVGQADVEVAVRGQKNPVDAILDEGLAGHGIGQHDPGTAGRGPPGMEFVERGQYLSLFIAGRRFEHHAGRARVYDNGNPVPARQLFDQQPHSGLEQGQLVGRVHGPGDIDEQHEIGCRALVLPDCVAFQADAQQQSILVPWRRRDLARGLERRCPVLGAGIGVVEVIDELFGPDRVFGGQSPLIEKAADIGVSARVHVDGKGRNRGFRRALDGVGVDDGILLAIHGPRRRGHGRQLRGRSTRPEGGARLGHSARLRGSGRGRRRLVFALADHAQRGLWRACRFFPAGHSLASLFFQSFVALRSGFFVATLTLGRSGRCPRALAALVTPEAAVRRAWRMKGRVERGGAFFVRQIVMTAGFAAGDRRGLAFGGVMAARAGHRAVSCVGKGHPGQGGRRRRTRRPGQNPVGRHLRGRTGKADMDGDTQQQHQKRPNDFAHAKDLLYQTGSRGDSSPIARPVRHCMKKECKQGAVYTTFTREHPRRGGARQRTPRAGSPTTNTFGMAGLKVPPPRGRDEHACS